MPRSMPRRDALTPLARCPGVALADSLIAAEAMLGQWHDQVVDSVEADYRPISLTSSMRKVIEKNGQFAPSLVFRTQGYLYKVTVRFYETLKHNRSHFSHRHQSTRLLES